MRAAAFTVLGACGVAPPVGAPLPPASNAIEGTVTDLAGSPIAGAEVVVCVREDPCAFISQRSHYTPGGVRDILATVPEVARAQRDLIIARTDATGRWRVDHAVHPPAIAWVLFLAADYVDVQLPQPSAAALREISLPPAAALDLVPSCSPAPCPEPYVAGLNAGGRSYDPFLRGTHLRHVPLGHYTVVVTAHVFQPGEQRGETAVDATTATAANAPVEVAVALAPTGTGRAISGSGAPAGIDVYARCGGVVRYARSGSTGDFQIDDVGAPPCQLGCERARLHVIPDGPERVETYDDCAGPAVTALPAHVRVGPRTR